MECTQFFIQPTIGLDFVSKNITIGEQTVRLQLWDFAVGQKSFRSLVPSFIRDCSVVILVFNITGT
jgi:Ras-related protein Rab-6A